MIVRVCDVYPDGRSILVVEYAQRARYRYGFDRQVLLAPGACWCDVDWCGVVWTVATSGSTVCT